MKLFDELLIKMGWTKTNSPTLKGIVKDNGVVNQRNIQLQGQNIYAEGDVVLPGKSYTWSEKREAAENLVKAVEAFFYSIIGRDGVGGLMAAQNLDANGQIKDHCLPIAKREFRNSKERLKAVVRDNASKLEEDDQVELHGLQDSLLQKDMYDVTKTLKEETTLTVELILKKYFEKTS